MTTRSPVVIYAERTRDEIKDHEIHGWRCFTGRVSLDFFLSLPNNAARRQCWAAMTDADRFGLALQILRLKGRELTAARITDWLAVMGERFGSSEEARDWGLETSLSHPPLAPSLSSLASPPQEVSP